MGHTVFKTKVIEQKIGTAKTIGGASYAIPKFGVKFILKFNYFKNT